MKHSEAIDRALGAARLLTYNDDKEGKAKHCLHELSHRLGGVTVSITKTRDGYLMTTLMGRSRRLTIGESIIWRLFQRPPAGYLVDLKGWGGS